ncbi:MAG: hypothetical protein K0R14_659 [Burkholderiales bacterium]|jgi:ElaB/YqjD/DUF883 family membrane-anchored ribosome-binding protein|nr:hypothetical protein [Burkholderiales bacterium]
MNNQNENKQEGEKNMSSMKDQVSDISKEAKNKAADTLDTIKSKGQDMAETVKDQAQNVDKALSGFVKDKPYIALASALFAGWVIAKVVL